MARDRIERPDGAPALIFVHPEARHRVGAECVVADSEWAVFARAGRPIATLDSGRHALDLGTLEFLHGLTDAARAWISAEVYFVRKDAFAIRLAGPLGQSVDPVTGVAVKPTCTGELTLRIENPERLVYSYYALGAAPAEPDPCRWLAGRFLPLAREALLEFARASGETLAQVMSHPEDLRAPLVDGAGALGELGARAVRLSRFEVDLSDDDLDRLRSMRARLR